MCLNSEISANISKGAIEVICGSMFSGKTEELLRRLKRVELANIKFVVFKPDIDKRYDKKKIVSHDKNNIRAIPIKNANEILALIKNANVVGIDEAQFFDSRLISICNKLANSGIRVVISGLDMDSNGKPFGIMPSLLAIAEKITKVHAICVACGEDANYSFRINENSQLINIGEKDKYRPLCRNCFKP